MLVFNKKTPYAAIKLKGGLGNQLFQFATVLAETIQRQSAFILNPPSGSRAYALNYFSIEPNTFYLPKIEMGELTLSSVDCNRFVKKELYEESTFDFQPIPKFESSFRLEGYFQSHRYFESIQEELTRWLLHKIEFSPTSHRSEVTLHVRLGDMARTQHFRDFHGIASSEYFIESLKFLNVERAEKITVITDDLNLFPKEHQKLLLHYPNITAESNSMISDFKTMTGSKNLVISNSTFGWWAGFLSTANVIAPRNWFKSSDVRYSKENFFPPEWKIL